jgi:hypothetical protein
LYFISRQVANERRHIYLNGLMFIPEGSCVQRNISQSNNQPRHFPVTQS